MRDDYGHAADADLGFGRFARPMRQSKGSSVDLHEARDAWEPTVCPGCGRDHSDPLSVRLKRAGSDVVARCSSCGIIAARYTAGVWSS